MQLFLTGQLLVNFDFFSHGSGDYFDVDSYSGVVDYENIPSYTSDTTGDKFELRDVLDFRPRVDDASTINSVVMMIEVLMVQVHQRLML